MPIFLTLELCKLYTNIVIFVTPGVEDRNDIHVTVCQFHSRCTTISVRTSLYLRNYVSNPITMCINNSTCIVKFLDPVFLKSIHDIQVSYITSNTYFVTFVMRDFNTFVIPGFNSIYKLRIALSNNFLFFVHPLNSIFISKYKYNIC